MDRRYYSVNEYYKNKYGCKVYKLSLSISNTCPNRDGKVGFGGCIFCSSDGSGDFAECLEKSVTEQIESAKNKVASKNKNGKYIAYFQSFTSTYISPQKLLNALLQAADNSDIVEISIGTRADCLGKEILDVLEKVNKIKPITVELGLQTSNEKTAQLINRCCSNEMYEIAVKNLKAIGIDTVAHIILGLPYETPQMMLNSAKYAQSIGVSGIKLQLLHVLKDTKLLKMYQNGEFDVLSMEEYFSILKLILENISPDIVIYRLTGDGDKKKLIAPLWSADKKRVLNSLNAYFENENVIQGKNI